MLDSPVFQNCARARILDATRQLMNSRTLEDISVKEILAAADVSRTTFYKHFPDKQALLSEIFQSELTCDNWFDYSQGWKQRHTWFLEHLLASRQFYLNALDTPEFAAAWKDMAVDANVRLLETIAADVDVSHASLTHFARFMSFGIVDDVVRWLENPADVSPAMLAERHALFVEYGLSGVVDHKNPVVFARPLSSDAHS